MVAAVARTVEEPSLEDSLTSFAFLQTTATRPPAGPPTRPPASERVLLFHQHHDHCQIACAILQKLVGVLVVAFPLAHTPDEKSFASLVLEQEWIDLTFVPVSTAPAVYQELIGSGKAPSSS